MSHAYQLTVKWASREQSTYSVDEYQISWSDGVLRCHTRSDDGTERWIVVPEGCITATKGGS